MNTMKKLTALLLAVAATSLAGRAQTTNFIVNEFNTAAEVTNATGFNGGNNGWGSWYSTIPISATFDPTSDSSNNPNSGSLKFSASFSTGDYNQYELYDGFFTYSVDAEQYTNLQFDVRFAPTSCLRTNGDNSTDFGYIQVGTWSQGYNQDYFSGFAIPSTTTGGQPNTNWVHISIPLNALTDSNLTNITDLVFHTINVYYGNTYNGTQTYWLDNIKFVGAAAPNTNPPPKLTITRAKPGLRIFAGSIVNTYDREELATADQNQSWIGGTYPVSYSYKLLDYPADIDQTHIFLLPEKFANNSIYNDEFIEYQSSNLLWMVLAPNGSNVTASVQWKTNLPNANPNQTALVITNPTAVGTWTLTFLNATNGTLTAPGAPPVPFTIGDPNVTNDFTNPLVAYFGVQPNTTAGEGEYEDWASINITGVAGANESEDFTTDTSLTGSGNFLNNSALAGSLQLATINTPYWVNWTVPDHGFELGVSDNLLGSTVAPNPWMLPEYYNNYGDGQLLPGQATLGFKTWVLIPSSCLPTVDGQPQDGQALSPDAFFLLVNPALTQ